MANITRFDPIKEIQRFDPFFDMDDVLNRFMMRPLLRSTMEAEPHIRMDVKEADGKYLVSAEIPGVSKNDIHVTVDGNHVSISAEVRHEKEVKKSEHMVCAERSYGLASRSFTLADDIDQSHVEAKYNNGVLELTLPKKAGAMRKEVTIS